MNHLVPAQQSAKAFWPETGPASEVGSGEAQGRTVNLSWTGRTRGTDEDYAWAWESVLLPIAKAFDPQLILVSAGVPATCSTGVADTRRRI